jgi:hypothetical protein
MAAVEYDMTSTIGAQAMEILVTSVYNNSKSMWGEECAKTG